MKAKCPAAARSPESRAYFQALGARVALLRKSQGFTQAELARAIGVSQQAVFSYELGERRVSALILLKLSRIFDISTTELMDMSKEQPPIKRRSRLSPAEVRHAERFHQLSRTQQRFVKRIIDVLLENS